MMLVQKQPNFTLSPPPSTFHHRRHPSAPPAVVVVQPTRTPGLLSLSKPQLQRHQPQQRMPRSPKLHISTAAAPVSPTPAPRGRQAKDKTVSTSRSDSVLARRHGHRQPSPPTPTQSSQAEGPSANPSNSDPFLVSAPSPTRPSAKPPRKRQPATVNPIPPFKSNPVFIPSTATKQPTTTTTKLISRSVPVSRNRPTNKQPTMNHDEFPICDDNTDAGDLSDSPPSYRPPPSPVTPTRRRPAPATLPRSGPPPFTPPSVANRRTGRNHRRLPSDSGMVFNMSSDDSGPETTRDDELRAMVKAMALSRTVVTSYSQQTLRTPPSQTRERIFEMQAQMQQGYFASSVFQNSPSPEELPDPLFV
ncbi:hypothetical protein Hypma_002277 [Hypsizygus marmoreus]|uniref:Uncharacterized protein n=1 Tax=Hypsizygus marmoreus TaxID=39966 RepID=A0A369K531_HYPMA|nr:hypothetical protein Hypma_002277 [Hypsizygus marmoreus]